MNIEIIPTVVPLSFDDIVAAAARYPFARALHVDFADGVFAPNTTWLPEKGNHFPTESGMQFEAHLMVQEPQEIGMRLVRAGCTRITGHVEAMAHVEDTLASWREAGAAEVGLGMLADTSAESVYDFVDIIDMLQMMTISKIGVQGLPFDESAPLRVRDMHERYPTLLISVDGSVNEKTILPLAEAGARRFCAGSVLSKAAEPKAMYRRLMALAESAI